MQTAGFVLAGGSSSRMGQNKAFLRVEGRTMIEIVAEAVKEAAGSVTIVGPPDWYRDLGYPVIPDDRPDCGPLAGIETALAHTGADWNLIAACDMPHLTSDMLAKILAEGLAYPEAGCVLPESGNGYIQPLCAAYHKRVLPVISKALDAGIRKVEDALHGLPLHYIRISHGFKNINTPAEFDHARDHD
jgi:molybdopterin-guanine dinucleotide biosynthesis protein A